MIELLAEVKASVFQEYSRAAGLFGHTNNSHHESYAVIKEEFEEANDCSVDFFEQMDKLWNNIKANVDLVIVKDRLVNMQELAEQASAEWIQVAAMCYKAQKKRQAKEAVVS